MKIKRVILTAILVIATNIVAITGCSVNEPPDVRDISGIWKISIGNEYSLDVKYLTINMTGVSVVYGNVTLDDNFIENNKLHAAKHFTEDSTFYINLTLTYQENYLVGYEYLEHSGQVDSVYVFGEKVAPLPIDTTETDIITTEKAP